MAALTALVPCVLACTAPGAFALPTGGTAATGAKLVSSASAAGPASPQTAALPAAEPGREQQGKVALALSSVSPKAAEASGKRGKVQITGTVQNHTGRQLPGLTIRMRYSGSPLTSRSQLERYAAAQPSALLAGVGLRPVQLTKAAVPNGSQSFSLSANTADIGMRNFGVYPVGVEVVNAAQEVVAGVTTFVTFAPKAGDVKPVKIGWVWPLIDRQHRTSGNVFTDDDLNAQMAKGGRLGGLVSAAAATRTPVTWAVDPALLDDARQMASGSYEVQGLRDDRSVKKPKSSAAESWLKSLKLAMKSDQYFALPYADPDVVALVRNKQNNQVALAYRNAQTATDVLGAQPSTPMAWPPLGVAGPGTLRQLVKYGRVTGPILMSSDNAFGPSATGSTPSAVTTAQVDNRPHGVLTYDDKLTEILDQNSRAPGGKVLTEQRFLAETAMITAERPQAAGRTLVVAPGRHWNPSPELARQLLADSASVPWLKAESLDKIAHAKPEQRQQKDYPDEFQGYELGPGYLDQVHRIQEEANSFASIVVNSPSPVYERAVLRLESVSWRGKPSAAYAARRRVSDQLSDATGAVKVVSKQTGLAGNSGMVHITVANDLPDQTVRVVVNVASENTAKLQIGKLEGRSPIDLGPGDKVTRNLPVTANGNGRFRLLIRLMSADGEEYGKPYVVTVRTTGYGRTSLVITGGALAVLFVGVGVRAMRARRRRKAEAAGDGRTGTEPATGAPGDYYPGAEPLVAGDSGLPEPGAGPGVGAGPHAGAGSSAASAGPAARAGAAGSTGAAAGMADAPAGADAGTSAGSFAGPSTAGTPAGTDPSGRPLGRSEDTSPAEPGAFGPDAGRHASGSGSGTSARARRESRATVRDGWSAAGSGTSADGPDADAGTSGLADAGSWFTARSGHEAGNGSGRGAGTGSSAGSARRSVAGSGPEPGAVPEPGAAGAESAPESAPGAEPGSGDAGAGPSADGDGHRG
ncbi:hypothetical protein DZF91_00165 [Actinomadura logoneensis]|uniref:Secreted protein n=1 Tax=Actinomadura logoneensis TaxID=2293572 RepID=A0A372JUI8_9ACTN|nr:DUF6049 family protein [Actinomadura logoneensis]RFU43630.1 hypothetical protein DZF91_00165 [Actinomadura logoneensis]